METTTYCCNSRLGLGEGAIVQLPNYLGALVAYIIRKKVSYVRLVPRMNRFHQDYAVLAHCVPCIVPAVKIRGPGPDRNQDLITGEDSPG
ncbi:hypothetical protein EYF80_014727 [Liparis tanakae]|uniref:Uncharacterized protein n=1 Tax=Liparis tanakae TaxID=230148 RepID=A0A4Z2IC46_9TELE|nr:hypothetical protein EYF80_014727 [Liparis tanakae]